MHGNRKSICQECGIKCVSCSGPIVKKKGDKCGVCQPVASRRSKVKEARVAAELKQWASEGRIPIYTAWDRANPDSKREICGKDRPDFSWDLGYRAVALEVDEFQHKRSNYVPRCQLIRLSRIVEGYGGIPVHIVRYNPDRFKIAGIRQQITDSERIRLLRKVMSEALAAPDLEHRIVIQHVWYDQATPDFVTTKRFKTLEDYEAWVQEEIPLEGYETQDYEALEEEEAHSEDDEALMEEGAP